MSITRNAMILLALLPLSACAPVDGGTDGDEGTAPTVSNPTPAEPTVSSPMPAEPVPTAPGLQGNCDAKAAQAFVGKTANAEVVAQAKAAAGADHARTLKPGQVVTMEFSAGRLNLDVDADNVITSARCG